MTGRKIIDLCEARKFKDMEDPGDGTQRRESTPALIFRLSLSGWPRSVKLTIDDERKRQVSPHFNLQ